MLRVYVAAPYARAPHVREVHDMLKTVGCKPTSLWAEMQTGAEELSDDAGARRVQRAVWIMNQNCLDEAHVVLVLSQLEGGGEMFAEVGRALVLDKPVLWTGPRRVLSCYADNARIMSGLSEALDELGAAAKLAPNDAMRVLLRNRDAAAPFMGVAAE